MGLFFNSDINKLYLGSTEVKEVYLGSDKVWPVGLPVGTTFEFDYTGDVQSVELPKGKYKLQCWGAQGGTSYGSSRGIGSKGGYSVGELTLNETTTLYIFVGGQGSRGSSTSLSNGGWNGGGASVGRSSYNSGGINGYSNPACGGGATDISTVTSSMSYSSGRNNRSSASLLSRCIVAGGGAGGSYRYTEETKTTTTTQEITSTNANYSMTSGGRLWFSKTISLPSSLKAGDSITVSMTPSSYRTINLRLKNSSNSIIADSNYTSSITMVEGAVTMNIDISYNEGTVTSSTSVTCSISTEVSTTSTSTSSGYSNESQQGGGINGGGQYPGTQSSGGKGNADNGGFGYGGNQKTTGYRYCSGGAGGGWYGGGTAYSDSSTSYVNYSGGGSGFVNTAANAPYRPSGYTGLQLDSGTTTAGSSSFESVDGGIETGHSGNGYARITVIK